MHLWKIKNYEKLYTSSEKKLCRMEIKIAPENQRQKKRIKNPPTDSRGFTGWTNTKMFAPIWQKSKNIKRKRQIIYGSSTELLFTGDSKQYIRQFPYINNILRVFWIEYSFEFFQYISRKLSGVEGSVWKCIWHEIWSCKYLRSSKLSLHKKWIFSLMISSVNETKSARNCWFVYIYWWGP